jgi:hypothetical protein
MRLPNGERALVPLGKLLDYCLNPDHPRGQHKARVFASALGITATEADDLRRTLLEAAATADAVVGEADDYGQRYVVDFEMDGPVGRAVVRSLWIIREGDDVPRLTSCFVL